MNCFAMEYDMATTEAQVTTKSTIAAIRDFVSETKRENFTTHDIAKHIGADEYHVRSAFGWLTRKKAIEVVPCVRCTRYTRTHGVEYSAAVYQLRSDGGPCDFKTLMRAFFG